MPLPLEVDHEQIKCIAIQVGYRETARQFGISENTILSWARREGWADQVRQIQQAQALKVDNNPLQSPALKSVAEVVLSVGDKSKLILGKTVCKTAKQLHKSKGDALITQTQALKATVDAGAKLFGWGSEGNTAPLVNINLLSAQLPEVPRNCAE